MKQKVNNTITSYLDDDRYKNEYNDISFNENSIAYTSTQIFYNNNYEIDHHIDRFLVPIRQSRGLLEKTN